MVQSLVSKDEYFWPSINVPKRDVFNVACGISRTTCRTFFLVSSAKYQDSFLPWIVSFAVDSVPGSGAGCGDGLLAGVGGFEPPPNSRFQMLIVLVVSVVRGLCDAISRTPTTLSFVLISTTFRPPQAQKHRRESSS